MSKQMTPLKVIRAKCLDCCGNQTKEVQRCTATACALYPYRMGKNPYAKERSYSELQKCHMRERMDRINSAAVFTTK